jgi:hypothetical protein
MSPALLTTGAIAQIAANNILRTIAIIYPLVAIRVRDAQIFTV